jgi:hypothetical protein
VPFNLLLLPLLGGYIFALRFKPTRYYVLRADKERLLFLSAICGFALAASVWVVNAFFAYFIPCSPDGFCIPRIWNQLAGIEYLGISVAAFLLGWLSPKLLNRIPQFSDTDRLIDKIIQDDANPFEILLRRSAKQSATVAVTMKSGKVYIGWVNHQFNPGEKTAFISLFPVQSGYREDKTQKLIRTVDYSKTSQKLKDARSRIVEGLSKLDKEADTEANANKKLNYLIEFVELEKASESFSIVLPVSEIVSVTLYSSKIHDEYFESEVIGVPKNLKAKGVSDTKVELSWEASETGEET